MVCRRLQRFTRKSNRTSINDYRPKHARLLGFEIMHGYCDTANAVAASQLLRNDNWDLIQKVGAGRLGRHFGSLRGQIGPLLVNTVKSIRGFSALR